jgi:ribosomal protein S10
MVQPKNKELYEKIKKEVISKYPKHSAYRSGLIVKAYKEAGGTYEGPKPKNTGLKRWFDEKWTNQRGQFGYKYKIDIYRPNIRITKDTPTTFSELTEKEVKVGRRKKQLYGRVDKFKT